MKEKYNEKNFTNLCNQVAYFNNMLKRHDRVDLTALPDYGAVTYELKIVDESDNVIVSDENNDLRSLSYCVMLEHEYIVKHPSRRVITPQHIGQTYLAYYMDSSEPEEIKIIEHNHYDGVDYYYIYLVDDKICDVYRYNEWSLFMEVVD